MSTSSPLISGHIIGVAVPGWGHQKPLAALASRIVQERSDILFTILAVAHFGKRIEKEINRYLPSETPKANIRIINIGGQPNDRMENFSVIIKNFEPVYKKLVHSEPIMCTTGRLYASAPRPTLAILDFFLPENAQVIRDISGNDVSILAWNTANASFCLRTLGPEKLGGYGDVAKQASEEAAATGRPVLEIEQELFSPSKGEVISIPGLPPIFDYEFAHKKASKDQFHNELLKKGQRFMQLCDGMISTSSIAYEKESLDAWRDWLAETNRHFYVVGPFLPPGIEHGVLTQSTKSNDLIASVNDQEIISFLDKNLKELGPNSLLYISFGSFFWPEPEHIWMLIDILLKLKFPFILAHASPNAVIPPDVSLKVQASGTGLLSPWAPQHLILDHRTTGWFLTHCGHNSVMEALGQGIPLIAWPINADQPTNAARLSFVDLAFELFETRVELGLKPLHRGVQPTGTREAIEHEMRKTLQDARGRIGERKRRNVHAVRDAIQGGWSEDNGDALKQLRGLLTEYFPS
ncbi:hypothetical protein BU17DRAFT_61044 [Hysterangium stoloniferum]|nr:hypothetical protein BU17DRAFT_61044 [Hysterangium stoloniferum]